MSNYHTKTVKTLHMKVNDDVVQIELQELQPGTPHSAPVWQLKNKQVKEVLDLVRNPVHARVHHYYLNHKHHYGQQQSEPPPSKQEIRTGQTMRISYCFKPKHAKQICLTGTPTSGGMSGHKVFPQKLVVYVHPLKSLYQQGVLVEQGESHYFSHPTTSSSQQPKLRDMFTRKKKHTEFAADNEARNIDTEETEHTATGEVTSNPGKSKEYPEPITLDDSPGSDNSGNTDACQNDIIVESDINTKVNEQDNAGMNTRGCSSKEESVKRTERRGNEEKYEDENSPPQENEAPRSSSVTEEDGSDVYCAEQKDNKPMNKLSLNNKPRTDVNSKCSRNKSQDKKLKTKKKKTRSALALMNISLSSDDEVDRVIDKTQEASKPLRSIVEEDTSKIYVKDGPKVHKDKAAIDYNMESISQSIKDKQKAKAVQLGNKKHSKGHVRTEITTSTEQHERDSDLSPVKRKIVPSSSEDDQDLPTLNSLILPSQSDSKNKKRKLDTDAANNEADEELVLTGVERKPLSQDTTRKKKQTKLSAFLRKSLSEMRQTDSSRSRDTESSADDTNTQDQHRDSCHRGESETLPGTSKNTGENSADPKLQRSPDDDVIVVEDDVEFCDEDFEQWFHESCVQQELYKEIQCEEERDMMADIQRAGSPKDLDCEQLSFLLAQNQRHLKNIFRGRQQCARHEDYKRGGKHRVNLTYQVPLDNFSDEQTDFIMEKLMKIFCKSHTKYLDYVLKVMFPESLVYISTIVNGQSYEAMLHDGL